MPKPEDWYHYPQHKEHFIPLFLNSLEIQIRVRFITRNVKKSPKKDVITFSVGLELKEKGKWKIIIRHCNYHDSPDSFHTHNPNSLFTEWGHDERIPHTLGKRKTPPSQFRWSVKDLKNNYGKYIKSYLQ